MAPIVTERLHHLVEIGDILAACLSYVINPISREFWDDG
jgi:hypothetical protein